MVYTTHRPTTKKRTASVCLESYANALRVSIRYLIWANIDRIWLDIKVMCRLSVGRWERRWETCENKNHFAWRHELERSVLSTQTHFTRSYVWWLSFKRLLKLWTQNAWLFRFARLFSLSGIASCLVVRLRNLALSKQMIDELSGAAPSGNIWEADKLQRSLPVLLGTPINHPTKCIAQLTQLTFP